MFKFFHNKTDKSGATVAGTRPDETDYLNDFLVSKSEHKFDDLQAAINELKEKMVDYNHVNYGLKIVHLPLIAAASAYVEFGVIDVRTNMYNIVERFDLREFLRESSAS